MDIAVEFLLRLLDHHPVALVDWDDLHGRFSALLAACQTAGFLSHIPKRHPRPSCPSCGEGVPYPLGGRHLCDRCHATVEPHHLQCWPLDLRAFLGWLAAQLHLRGEVRSIDGRFWQLGAHADASGSCECFFSLGGRISGAARERLLAHRSAVILYGWRRPSDAESLPATAVSLLEVLGLGEALHATHWAARGAGAVLFDAASGRLDAGGFWCGEVSPGSREHAFLACLASSQGQFVGYARLKQVVLQATGGRDTRDAASFCHRIKSRIKKRHVLGIDSLVSASNKGDGYRLLARREP
ncbi:MAG: hypothetical protein ACRC33_23195 [Gemmataceae bacterium]